MKSKKGWLSEIAFWDWKSIWGTIAFLSGTFLFFFFMFNRGHFAMMLSKLNYKGQANGWVIERHMLTGLVLTTTGNKERANGLVVTYTYPVNGVVYRNEELLNYSIIDALELDALQRAKLPAKIKVRYDQSAPENAAIVIE